MRRSSTLRGLQLCHVLIGLAVTWQIAGAEHIIDLGQSPCFDEPPPAGSPLEFYGVLPVQTQAPIPFPGLETGEIEYTFYLEDLDLLGDPGAFEREYGAGTIRLWADPTPDVTGPCEPTLYGGEGEIVLSGIVASFVVLDFTQVGASSGAIFGVVHWMGGTRIDELIAMGLRTDWQIEGGFTLEQGTPYGRVFEGELWREPVPVEAATWGQIKSMLRGRP